MYAGSGIKGGEKEEGLARTSRVQPVATIRENRIKVHQSDVTNHGESTKHRGEKGEGNKTLLNEEKFSHRRKRATTGT